MSGGELERLREENRLLRDALGDATELRAAFGVLQEENRQFRERVEALEHQVSLHPGNSGLPPSPDCERDRKAQESARECRAERRGKARARLGELESKDRSTRPPGKQPGGKGYLLVPVDEPDERLTHAPRGCSGCCAGLVGAELVGLERRQVFDAPAPVPVVVEHLREKRRCGCGVVTAGLFPPEATAVACYGPRLRALAVYLVVRA